jgi:hypothetical protein
MPSCKILLLTMNIRNALTFAFLLFLLPAAAASATHQDPDKEEITVRSDEKF